MPRRKITLEEAFAAFEAHGLQVEVKDLLAQPQVERLSAFTEDVPVEKPSVQQVSQKKVRITLYCQHTVSAGGFIRETPEGHVVAGNSIETYGPGIITVPADLAQHLLHQDMVAREADRKVHDRVFRSYALLRKGGSNVGVQVSEDSGFDISTFLGELSNRQSQAFMNFSFR